MGLSYTDVAEAASSLSKREFSPPNSFQVHTVVAACVMLFLSGIFWNAPFLRDAIAGVKLLVVASHEFFHIVFGLLCGGSIVSVSVDPNAGGATHILGLMPDKGRLPQPYQGEMSYGQVNSTGRSLVTLTAGYIGSSIIGFFYVWAAFDIVGSKIASFVIAFSMLVPLVRADTLIPFASVFCLEMILVGMWFGDHGSALRFYVLWVGIFNLFYPVWDYIDERLFDKPNTSDCTQFADLTTIPAPAWFVLWTVYDCLVFVAAIIAGIIVFQKTPEQMYADAAGFLPT